MRKIIRVNNRNVPDDGAIRLPQMKVRTGVMSALLLALAVQGQPRRQPVPAESPKTASLCKVADEDEIVVCANADGAGHRIIDLEPRFTEKPFRAEFKIPGLGIGRLYAEQRAVGTGGESARAVMISVGIPLGSRKTSRK